MLIALSFLILYMLSPNKNTPTKQVVYIPHFSDQETKALKG